MNINLSELGVVAVPYTLLIGWLWRTHLIAVNARDSVVALALSVEVAVAKADAAAVIMREAAAAAVRDVTAGATREVMARIDHLIELQAANDRTKLAELVDIKHEQRNLRMAIPELMKGRVAAYGEKLPKVEK